MKVRSKERFTAEQWFSHEKPVKYVRHVDPVLWRNECPFCNGTQEAHGQVETREHTRVICSGDWVVTKVVTNAQEVYRPFRFHENFEIIKEDEDEALLNRILETQRRINEED